MRRIILAAALAASLLWGGAANAVCVTLPYTLLNGTLADAAQVMGNFNAIATCVNGTQTANTVFAGPTTGGAAAPAFRALVGADLPNPSSTTLGGIQSIAAVSHKFLTAISTSGVPANGQPAAADLSDGVSGTGAVVLASGPTLTAPHVGWSNNTANCPNPATSCVVNCPAAQLVVGGGGIPVGSSPMIVFSYAVSNTSWTVGFDAAPVTNITANAICMGVVN